MKIWEKWFSILLAKEKGLYIYCENTLAVNCLPSLVGNEVFAAVKCVPVQCNVVLG